MQRGAPVNTHSLCGFLKLMLAGFIIVLIVVISPLFLISAPSGPILLLLGLATAASSATTLLAGPLSTVLGSLLISPFVFNFLFLDKLLNLPAVLKVMALGAMDLAILLVGALRLAGSRQGLTGGTPGNILAGTINLDLLGGAGVAGFLDGKHGLAPALPIAPSALLCRGDGVFVSRIASRSGIFAGVLPSFFSPSTSVGQNIKLGNIHNLVHRQLFTHLAVAHILMKCTDDGSGMNI